MSKVLFTLVIKEPKIRKAYAPKTQVIKDKKKYSRKAKHKNRDENSGFLLMRV